MAQVFFDEVHALATWVASIFYGALIVLYLGCVWVLTNKQRSTGTNKPMLCTATAMVFIATAHNAVSILRNIEAFFEHKDGNPIKYFSLSSNFLNLFQTSLSTAQILVGDGILVYRCYVVYGRDPRILLLPILLLLGTLACGIVLIFQFAIVDAKSVTEKTYFNNVVQPWSTGLKVVSMVQNILTTAAIAVKIWMIGYGSYRRLYWRATMLVLESGVIYTVIMLILLVLNLAKQNTYAIIYYAIVPIVGIIFTSMIIAVGLRDINPVTSGIATDSVVPIEDRGHKFKRRIASMTFASRRTDLTETQDNPVFDGHGPLEHTVALSELPRPSKEIEP